MALSERISADLTRAMKAGETLRRETLRTILAGLKEKIVERRPAELTPEDELAVLTQAAKKRREAAEIFSREGRADLAGQEEAELRIIEEYLPAQMTEAELKAVVVRVISATGAAGSRDFGKVMPLVMKEVKGKIDGKIVQSTVKTLLEGPPHGIA